MGIFGTRIPSRSSKRATATPARGATRSGGRGHHGHAEPFIRRPFTLGLGANELLAMQKVEGSSPFIRFARKPR